MELAIYSPEKTIYNGEANGVTVPGAKGLFEILDFHAPIISSLQSGMLTYKTPQGEFSIEVAGGFVNAANNKVSVCIEEM